MSIVQGCQNRHITTEFQGCQFSQCRYSKIVAYIFCMQHPLGFRTAKNSDKTAWNNSFVFSWRFHLIYVFCHVSFLLSRYISFLSLVSYLRDSTSKSAPRTWFRTSLCNIYICYHIFITCTYIVYITCTYVMYILHLHMSSYNYYLPNKQKKLLHTLVAKNKNMKT